MDSGGGGLVSTLDDYAAFARMLADGGVVGGLIGGQRLLSERLFAELSRNQLADGVDGPAGYTGPGFGFGLGLAVRHDWGPAAMPCTAGELTWSGVSGTALFVQPRQRWFAVLMSANMASRMMARMTLRRALAG
jgi:CubicO group peptidase (beta-lactamase class C family)